MFVGSVPVALSYSGLRLTRQMTIGFEGSVYSFIGKHFFVVFREVSFTLREGQKKRRFTK